MRQFDCTSETPKTKLEIARKKKKFFVLFCFKIISYMIRAQVFSVFPFIRIYICKNLHKHLLLFFFLPGTHVLTQLTSDYWYFSFFLLFSTKTYIRFDDHYSIESMTSIQHSFQMNFNGLSANLHSVKVYCTKATWDKQREISHYRFQNNEKI